MSADIHITKNGVRCNAGSTSIYLDPKNTDAQSINFISHAHADHLPSGNGGTILTSAETAKIASLRGFKIQGHIEEADCASLVDSGHVLGSKGLLFGDVFYTGDICTRSRGFLSGARIPKCRTLIMECTFGLPEFIFPEIKDIQRRVNELISEMYNRGMPVILLGYQLGKAQTLTQLFGHWEPLYLHDSVMQMNQLHQSLGVQLKNGMSHSEAQKRGLLDKKPWLMIAPTMSSKNKFIVDMKSRYGAITIGFSGWAQSNKFAIGKSADYFFPLSDHCDFAELVDVAVRSGAEQVYTVHGFVSEFAQSLQKMGINARPMHRRVLDDFTG